MRARGAVPQPASGLVVADPAVAVGGAAPELVVSYQITAEDLEGPFVEIPEDIAERARQAVTRMLEVGRQD